MISVLIVHAQNKSLSKWLLSLLYTIAFFVVIILSSSNLLLSLWIVM